MGLGSVRPLQRLAYVLRIKALELALEQAQDLLDQDELTPLRTDEDSGGLATSGQHCVRWIPACAV